VNEQDEDEKPTWDGWAGKMSGRGPGKALEGSIDIWQSEGDGRPSCVGKWLEQDGVL
jgi:hypothetical protein